MFATLANQQIQFEPISSNHVDGPFSTISNFLVFSYTQTLYSLLQHCKNLATPRRNTNDETLIFKKKFR
ncbi:hypothetical protein NQ317_006557 [Molorchus minor]|uniref:Uncharacterized protein n=1 Tax=Molorchus minor TaxID=1323400 RepID=A0ABQ9K1P1_9CUCU|nr:hypothetical protein NQ317_006557 [Molorchus minor]